VRCNPVQNPAIAWLPRVQDPVPVGFAVLPKPDPWPVNLLAQVVAPHSQSDSDFVILANCHWFGRDMTQAG
jgi:hypothetical protein